MRKKCARGFAGRQDGAVVVVVAVAMTALLGAGALAIDVGHLWVVKTRLQAAADASALAGAGQLPDDVLAVTRAVEYGDLNDSGVSNIVEPGDVQVGNWDPDARLFTQGANPLNAVRVRAERSTTRGNPVHLSLGRLVGTSLSNASASATAWSRDGGGPSVGTRFLIDEELIDTDIPAIEQLAEDMGVTPDDLVNDNDGDWYIDLPEGTELTLPTGQEYDEGLFDITHPSFPFSDSSDPSYADFLNFNEDGTWRQDLVPKSMLDPLLGPAPVRDTSRYPSFVNPDFCNVTPVFKSDISELNPIGDDPAVEITNVNALGERRGLLSFAIIGIGEDPDGPTGSYLPDIIIRVCPPTLPDGVTPPSGLGGGGLQLVLVE